MKQKIMMIALMMGMVTLSACSDDDDAPATHTKVPAKVEQAFKAKYPQVTDVQWDHVKEYHVARFNAPKARAAYNTNAWFTDEGAFCQTDEDIAFSALPVAVQESFNRYKETFYPDWELDDCEVLVRAGMSPIFVIEIEKGDLEREISVAETGEILKDVLDDDDEDEILPILIPDEIYAALKAIFPETHHLLSILELEFDDDEIEIDIIEDGRHKEVELNLNYQLVSVGYKATMAEAMKLINQDLLEKLVAMAEKAGIDLLDENFHRFVEIEVKETAKGVAFEIEIEMGDLELEIEIDENGNIKIDD